MIGTFAAAEIGNFVEMLVFGQGCLFPLRNSSHLGCPSVRQLGGVEGDEDHFRGIEKEGR